MLTSLLLLSPISNSRPEAADLVVLHANVLTIDARKPRAQAFAVSGGKFIAVGSDKEMQRWVGPTTRVIDGSSKTIVPGFIDAHMHPGPIYAEESPYGGIAADPDHVKSIDDLIASLKRKAERTPKGQLVWGERYQDTKLGRHPTRQDLDRASTDHPIIVSHSSGHISACNSLALALAKVTKDTPDPKGGAFDRDADGTPNGVLREAAAGIVRRALPDRPTPPPDAELQGYAACYNRFAARGITSLGIAGTDLGMVDQMQTLKQRGMLPVRLYIMLWQRNIPDLVARKERLARGERSAMGDEWIHLGAIKNFHGNSFSGRTCWLYEPYPGRPDYFGIPPARTQEQLNALVLEVHKAGLQSCIHSNGDREIDMVLNAYENAQKLFPRKDARHRIEHCSVANERILRRLKALNVIMVQHSYEWEHGDKMLLYGERRVPWLSAYGDGVRMGVLQAQHSDYPVSAADPLLRIQSMVTRKSAEGVVVGPRQKVTVEQALKLWTLDGAFAEFEEKSRGSIEVGKLADFVVLSQDPRKVDPDRIKDIPITMTVVGGEVKFTGAH